MRIAVMGSGGLGGYYGALLARLGEEVHFIARGAHLDALRSHGLTVKSVHGDFTVAPAHATADPAEIGVADLILFAVKTYDTEAAARALVPAVGPATIVLTFQNGVESHEHIDEAIGLGHTILAPTQIGSTLAAPGLIVQQSSFRNTTIGEVTAGLTQRVERLVSLFAGTGITVVAAENGLKPLWHKFVFLASIAGVTTLARTGAYELFQRSEARDCLREAMDEVYRVGLAHGVPLDQDIVERQYQFAISMGQGIKASMHVDLERRRRLEIDALSGAVVRLGEARSVATPVHRTIYAALSSEDRRAAASV